MSTKINHLPEEERNTSVQNMRVLVLTVILAVASQEGLATGVSHVEIDTRMSRGPITRESVSNFKEQQAVLTDDMVFQRVGKLYPHETNLLIRTVLSYAALEAVPQKTEDIANTLKELAENLTKVHEVHPVPGPLVLPRYIVFDNGSRVNIRQARLRCKTAGMRLLAPADNGEFTDAVSFGANNFTGVNKNTRIWIDAEWNTQSSQWVNPVNKEPLADIYKDVRINDADGNAVEWKVARDDHLNAFALNPKASSLESKKIEGLESEMDAGQWYYVQPGTKEPEASFVCQGFKLDKEMISQKGEITDVRQLYARENARLPLQEIIETEKIFRVMAQDQRRRFIQLMERYDLQQPLLGDTPENERVKIEPMRPLHITIKGPKRKFVVTSGEDGELRIKGPKKAFKVTASHRITKRIHKRETSVGEHLLFNIGRSIPLIGPYIGTVADVLREKRNEAFRDATGEGLRHLYRTVAAQAKEIKGIRFAEEEMSLQIRTIQNEVTWLHGIISDVALYLEVNAVVDRLRTKALATHSEFLVQADKFERWINAMLRGNSPDDLYTGGVLKELRNVVAEQGLTVEAQFQDTESMILPNENRTKSVVVLSSVRATSPAWTIYRQRSIPRFFNSRLFREKLMSDYIAISPKYNQYVPLNKDQINRCRDKVCPIMGPTRSLVHAECGTRTLIGDPDEARCPIVEIDFTEEFLELEEGGLLFSVKNPIQVSITCPYEEQPKIQRHTLKNRGIIFIKPGCQLMLQNGNTYRGMPGSKFMAHVAKDVTKLAVDSVGLGKLKNDIEALVEITSLSYEITSNGPQIALFTAVVLIAIALFSLCCWVLHIKKYTTRLRRWISPWSVHRTPPSAIGPQNRNLKKERNGCAETVRKVLCCPKDIRDFPPHTPSNGLSRQGHVDQFYLTPNESDSIAAVDGSPVSDPIRSAMLSGGMVYPQTMNSGNTSGDVKTSSPFAATSGGNSSHPHGNIIFKGPQKK